MTRPAASREAKHFERLYAASDDPWNFRNSDYEREKYLATLSALPNRRFTSALEVGCSIGELTRMLAPRCERLLAIDLLEAPLVLARKTCAEMAWVTFRRMTVPRCWPSGKFDLILFSEVLYFLSLADIEAVAAWTRSSLTSCGTVLLVNWIGKTEDPTSGDEAATAFFAAVMPLLRLDLQTRTDCYRLDRLLSSTTPAARSRAPRLPSSP